MMKEVYSLEFVLYVYDTSEDALKKAFAGFGYDIAVSFLERNETERGDNFKVCMKTDDPLVVFDACAELGKIKSVRVNEEQKK